MEKHRIYSMSFASVYPLYIAKVERKGCAKTEVDKVIRWLTGYSQKGLESQIKKGTDFKTFFAKAPKLNPNRRLIKGVICGVRVEDIKEPTMQAIRYLDKLVDELAHGRDMQKILRTDTPVSDLPKISNPASRALANAKITSLKDIAKYTEKEILNLHGIGPTAIPILKKALKEKGLSFKNKIE